MVWGAYSFFKKIINTKLKIATHKFIPRRAPPPTPLLLTQKKKSLLKSEKSLKLKIHPRLLPPLLSALFWHRRRLGLGFGRSPARSWALRVSRGCVCPSPPPRSSGTAFPTDARSGLHGPARTYPRRGRGGYTDTGKNAIRRGHGEHRHPPTPHPHAACVKVGARVRLRGDGELRGGQRGAPSLPLHPPRCTVPSLLRFAALSVSNFWRPSGDFWLRDGWLRPLGKGHGQVQTLRSCGHPPHPQKNPNT